jgi:hypothetical protein
MGVGGELVSLLTHTRVKSGLGEADNFTQRKLRVKSKSAELAEIKHKGEN